MILRQKFIDLLFLLLGLLNGRIIICNKAVPYCHYCHWNYNLFTFHRSFIVQWCRTCHGMNVMLYDGNMKYVVCFSNYSIAI
jgi:hypothetical protein